MTDKETEVFSDTIGVDNTGVFLQRLSTSLLLLLSAIILLFVVGFAEGSGGFLHDAAHDTRHAVTFPCH
tara:strand:+ start:283 stop:489 length:207 start_codon:yes stop_codon:yes gene_type:complete